MDSQWLIELFNNYEGFAVIISLIISIIIALLAVVPSIFVTAANIMFFGPFMGFLISLLGETIGAYITFELYRRGLKNTTEALGKSYKLIDRITKAEGRRAGFLIFEARLIPFIPSGFVTIAASLSNVSAFIFTFYSFLGKIPSIALEAFVSNGFINAEEGWIKIVITVVSIILILFTIFKKEGSK